MKGPLTLFFAIVLSAASLFGQGNPYSTGPIQGEVDLPNGQPVPNAYLQLKPEGGGGLIQSASTDSAGHFSFTGGGIGAGGNYVISLKVQGYEPVHRLVMLVGPETYVSITLVPKPGAKPSKAGIVSVQTLQIPVEARHAYENGLQSLNRGNASEAESAFKKAIRIYPKFTESYLRLSFIYADQNRFSEARDAIHQATRIAKPSSETYAYLGYLYMKEKQPRKAERTFRKSIGMKRNDWFAQMELGRLLYNRKDYKGAYPHFLLARKLGPQMASAHLMLYDDLIRLNKLKQALVELDDFVARFTRNPQAARMRKMRPALAAAAARQH